MIGNQMDNELAKVLKQTIRRIRTQDYAVVQIETSESGDRIVLELVPVSIAEKRRKRWGTM